LLDRASPLRTAHLRDPVGPQIEFASETFIDELAAAIGADPVAFRLRYLKEPHPSTRRDRTGDTLTGRGIADPQRSGAVVAIVADVEIDRRTGKGWARKFTVAHDCGLIINPDGLRRCIEGNVVQVTSRALSEEVAFEIDLLTVLGKAEPVRAYEIMAPAGCLSAAENEMRSLFAEGLAAYRARDWDASEQRLAQCMAVVPKDGPAACSAAASSSCAARPSLRIGTGSGS
jgi:hypothetical protein